MSIRCLPALLLLGGVVSAQSNPAKPDAELAALVAEIETGMLAIPAGSFQMGSDKGDPDEKPIHRVEVKAFKLGRHEVTFAQYDVFAEQTGRARPDDAGDGRGRMPAVNISWDDAQAFIAWLNKASGRQYRLPSEAEWEYAARAGSTTDYPWGSSFDDSKANSIGKHGVDQWERGAPVGSFPPNAFGAYDMSGNVWEWTADCRNTSYDKAPADGSAWTSGECNGRIYRGGSWYNQNASFDLRITNRSGNATTLRNDHLGFRLARDN